MESMSWDELRLILALAREGSLLGAAKVLGVNASTVGRRLDAVEDLLGVRIFDRTRQGVLMTAVAEQMIPFAESAELAAAGFLRVAEGFDREVEGLVRLSAPPGVASYFLGTRLGPLLSLYPKLQLQIDAETGYADLSRRETDIALRGHRPQSGDLISVRLGQDVLRVCGSPAYFESVGKVTSWSQLRWITWGPRMAHLTDITWLMERVPPSSVILRTDSIEVQIRAAEAGIGVVLLHSTMQQATALQALTLPPPLQKELDVLPLGELWLVGHRALRDVPRIAVVWDAIVQGAVFPVDPRAL
ncbi:MAG: LysR family transcriptional regulator [Myxococcales bacterium]|nr:LysR family transcriptional regulator [Myxococcales bacterium]